MAQSPKGLLRYGLLPPGLYKVRKCDDDPGYLEVMTGDYEGRRIAIPRERFQMPENADAVINVAIINGGTEMRNVEPSPITQWEYTSQHCNANTERGVLDHMGLQGWEAWHAEGTTSPDGKGGHIFGSIIYFKRIRSLVNTALGELPYDPNQQDPYAALAAHFNMPRERMKQLILDAVKPK